MPPTGTIWNFSPAKWKMNQFFCFHSVKYINANRCRSKENKFCSVILPSFDSSHHHSLEISLTCLDPVPVVSCKELPSLAWCWCRIHGNVVPKLILHVLQNTNTTTQTWAIHCVVTSRCSRNITLPSNTHLNSPKNLSLGYGWGFGQQSESSALLYMNFS